jgi:multimeric flavodoxin WrbA
MKQLQQKGEIEFEEISLHEINIPYCQGCSLCLYDDEKLCPHSETISEIEKKISSADGLIFGLPVYVMNVCGEVKNLIDHLAYSVHRPRFFKQDVLIVATTSGIGAKKVAKYLKMVFAYQGFRNISILPVICGDGNLKISTGLEQKVAAAAGNFYRKMISENPFRPSWKQIVYYNLFRASALAGKAANNGDYRYFHETGLLHKNHYYELGLLKNLFASFTFSVLKKLVKY